MPDKGLKFVTALQVTVTNSGTALPSRRGGGFLLQADPANTNDILVGDSVSQPFVMEAKAVISVDVDNLKDIYVIVAAGTETLNILGVL